MQNSRAERALQAVRKISTLVADCTHLIWDWNGTLLDDVQFSTDVIAEVLREHALTPITVEHYRSIFGFPVIRYYEKLGFDFSQTPFEAVGGRFISRYTQGVHATALFDGTKELLSGLTARGVRQWILSAASQDHLDRVTERFGVRQYFADCFGIDNHYAASKVERGKELMRREKFPREKTLLIGDTDHDLEVARELGISALLIADGHQSYARLSALHDQVLETRF